MLKRIRQISLMAALIGLLVILRSLPVENGIDLLIHWVDGKGIWGPIVFGLAYMTAALLLVPGSVLTLAAGAVWAHGNEGRLADLFGPPAAKLSETYGNQRQGEVFAHATLNGLLSSHVDEAGYVDYQGLAVEEVALDDYLESIAGADFEALGRDEKLAFLINAYNAFTLRLILDYQPLASIKDIPSSERWDAARRVLAGTTVSLNQIEHELIRPNFAEPRIHFALVYAAVGCPPLRSEAYTGDMLEQQLGDQSQYVHTHARWFDFEDSTGELGLTALYDWYGGDFEQVAGSTTEFAARYSPDLQASLTDGSSPTITWLDYDWRLNSKDNAQ